MIAVMNENPYKSPNADEPVQVEKLRSATMGNRTKATIAAALAGALIFGFGHGRREGLWPGLAAAVLGAVLLGLCAFLNLTWREWRARRRSR